MIRAATKTDPGFIHSIVATHEKSGYIVDVPGTELLDNITDPAMDLLIWEREGTPAGFALFCGIGNLSGRVELHRLGLNRTGTGLGQPFLRALVDHAFDTIGAARVWLDVIAANTRARVTYRHAGFTHEGTLRQNRRAPTGAIVDMQVYGMLETGRPGNRE
jgi:RimJ/RimL family protein N-acetyltransferase